MPTLARKPARGNWIWLGGALCAVVVLAAVAVGASIGGPTDKEVRMLKRGISLLSVTALVLLMSPSAQATGDARSRSTSTAANAYRVTRLVSDQPGMAAHLDPNLVNPFPAAGRYVSLPPERFGHSAACGSYLTVQGPRGQVRAEVVDLCPGCAADMINLSRAAFTRIAAPGPGSARIRFWPVNDPPLPGPLILRMAQTPTGLLTLQVRRHGNALASVAVGTPGTQVPAWQPFTLSANGIWVAGGHLGQGPFNIRITDTGGHQAVILRVTLPPGRVIHTRTWMYGHGHRQAGRAG